VANTFEIIDTVALEPIANAIGRATEITLGMFLGEEPRRNPHAHTEGDDADIAGIMSFFGEANASFAMLLSRKSATGLVHRMLGFELDFDSPDMVDGVGELVNVIAGEIVAQIELLGYRTAMSLPMVIRGRGVSISPRSNIPMIDYDYDSTEGVFSIEVVSRMSCEIQIGKPGHSSS